MQALQALFSAQTADAIIKAADELITNFADTDYKGAALQMEAKAYQAKGQNEKAIVYAEQALDADAKNFDAMSLLANIYSSTTRESDLDKNEKLAKAEKYANDAINAVKDAPKPNPQITDEQWNGYKAGVQADAMVAIASANVIRKKYDDAKAGYDKAYATSPDPYTLIRAGRAMMTAGKYDEAIAYDDKVISAPNVDPNAKNIATKDKEQNEKLKAAAKK